MSLLSIFVLLCCTVVCVSSQTCSGDSCKKFSLNKEHFNQRYRGPGLYEMSTPGHHDCVRNCFILSPCKSTDFNMKAKMCKLNDVDSTQITASDFEQQNGGIFSDITAWPPKMAGKCGSRPCSKRQRCLPDRDTYHCVDISCSGAPYIQNGKAVLSKPGKYLYGDTATVLCDNGFSPSQTTVRCNIMEKWEKAVCVKDCGNPDSLCNGNIVLNSGTIYQDTASVTCDAGYEGSVNTISCTASSSWETVTCEPISCGNPTTIANGNVVLNSGTTYQSTASVTCDVGYETSANIISCTVSGSWNAVTCDPIPCGDPATVSNGNIVLNSGTTYQDTASVTCDAGYEGSVNTISCTATGSWESVTCDPISCGNPTTIANGNVVLNSGTKYQDTASVTCDDGFEGSVNTISCTASGSWEAVTCDPISCGNPAPIANGNVDLNSGTMYQDTASVTCDVGYERSANTISCTVSGSWDAVTCDPIPCGDPATVSNGNIVLNSGTTYQDTASVTCDAGYEGSVNTISCTATGSWESVTCDPISCGNPTTIANGNVVLNSGTTYQDTASVTCHVGFEGSINTISCTTSGSWEAVTCDPISCGNPSPIANGMIVLNSGTIYQDTASVTCDVGYERSVNTISCTDSGSWDAVTCDPIPCGDPATVSNGNIVLNSGTTYQDTASVTCDAGYEGSVNTISCTATGSWESVTCDPISCGNPTTIANGNVILNSGTTYQDTASVTCDAGYEESVNTISCTASGSWEVITCDPISCGNPSSIANGNVVLNSGATYQDTASVTCDDGYEGSVNTISCMETGNWETVTCDPISCGNPPSIDNGNVVLNSGTMYLDTASVTCNKNFQANSSTIKCTASGSWETATCKAVDCYVNNVWDYEGSKNITRSGYPCERWVDNPDWVMNVECIPESTLEEANNYCRNPVYVDSPLWCFSSNPAEIWEPCDIPQCE